MLFQIPDSMSELQDIDAADLVEHEIGDLNAQTDEEWYPYNTGFCIKLYSFRFFFFQKVLCGGVWSGALVTVTQQPT